MKRRKLLFVTCGENLDYQNDSVFHGLCSLPDTEVAILNENSYDYMFKGLRSEAQLRSLYGKGFTLANRVPVDRKCVHSRDEVLNNLRSNYYDFRLTRGCRYRFFQERKALRYAEMGLYYKRELLPQFRNIFRPISFAIPDELIVEKVPENKTRRLAFIVPGKLETYIYKDEESYYKGYQEAIFGVTCKKCGWDCLRHYEILANGCIPYFPDIADLPPDTMTFFPKVLVRYGNMLYETKASDEECLELNRRLLEHTRKFLTTRFLAEYLLLSARGGN